MDDRPWGDSKLPAFAEDKETVNDEGGREGESKDKAAGKAGGGDKHSEVPFRCEVRDRGRQETAFEWSRFS